MKSVEIIKNEIKELETRMSETFKLHSEGVYTEKVFKTEMTRLESARNALEWVLK